MLNTLKTTYRLKREVQSLWYANSASDGVLCGGGTILDDVGVLFIGGCLELCGGIIRMSF